MKKRVIALNPNENIGYIIQHILAVVLIFFEL